MAESENALIKASAAEPECQRLLQDGPYVAPMAGLLRFSRPLNCVMSAVGVGIGGGVGGGAAAGGGPAPPLPLAAAPATPFNAGRSRPPEPHTHRARRGHHTVTPAAS